MKSRSLKQLFEPYADVLIFMITLFAADFFWKWTVAGDENGDMVTWFGMDVTAPFEFMACHIARVVYWLVSLFRDTAYMVNEHTIRFASGSGTTIIWGCTAIKQSFIWFWLIATVLPVAHRRWPIAKLWYIPLGWLACYVFNIIRIFLIALFIEYHPEWFHILHDYIFKYLFYGMLFALWAVFVEKIRPRVLSR